MNQHLPGSSVAGGPERACPASTQASTKNAVCGGGRSSSAAGGCERAGPAEATREMAGKRGKEPPRPKA
eukprot:345659-Chlamydomonas_euryale.AAC.4